MCGVERSGSWQFHTHKQSVSHTQKVHSKEVSLRSAGQATCSGHTFPPKTPPVAFCVYILCMRSHLGSSKLTQAKLLSQLAPYVYKLLIPPKVTPYSSQSHLRILRSRQSSAVVLWAGNSHRCSGRVLWAPLVESERAVVLGKPSKRETIFINWSPESAYLCFRTGDNLGNAVTSVFNNYAPQRLLNVLFFLSCSFSRREIRVSLWH